MLLSSNYSSAMELALLDLDGTIKQGDTIYTFLRQYLGKRRFRRGSLGTGSSWSSDYTT